MKRSAARRTEQKRHAIDPSGDVCYNEGGLKNGLIGGFYDMFRRAGYKLQKIAVIFFIVCALAAIGGAVWCFRSETMWNEMETGLRVLICVGIALGGVLLSWLLSLPIYAYGRMTECVEEMADARAETDKKLATLIDTVEHLPVLRMGSAPVQRETKAAPEAETELPRDKRYFSETPVGVREWVCPECGKSNPPTEEKCVYCGAGGLWQCKKCGKVSTYNLDICPGCGTVDNRRCRHCGKENPRNSRVCAHCEKNLFIGDV